MTDPFGLVESLRVLTSSIIGERSLQETLHLVAMLGSGLGEQTDGAGAIWAAGPDGDPICGASHDFVRQVQQAQCQLGEGPALSAMERDSGLVHYTPGTDSPWPRFAAAAVRLGISGAVVVPLALRGDALGSLGFYSRTADTAADPPAGAGVLAGYATISLVNAGAYESATRTIEQFQAALTSRAVIDQAKGVLVATRSCSAEEAFGILVQASQQRHVKLRDLAADVVRSATDGEPVEKVIRQP